MYDSILQHRLDSRKNLKIISQQIAFNKQLMTTTFQCTEESKMPSVAECDDACPLSAIARPVAEKKERWVTFLPHLLPTRPCKPMALYWCG